MGIIGHGIRDGTVGSGTALKAGRAWIRLQIVSLKFFIDIILGSTQSLTEMSTRNIYWG